MFGKIFTVAALAVGGAILSKQMKKSGNLAGMSTVEESIDVDVPISTAYNQWTQFEDFPQFMSSVHEVRQFDDTRLHWKATVAGKEKQWDAEITHQIPDKKIAWRSTTGVPNAGAVTFDRLSDTRTRINLKMSYSPETFTEKVGDTLGAVKLQAKQNLSRFKEMLESRGTETGAWRGTVAQPHH
ncbi:SRPBCC family protein [Noviherbaspirillum autotrophicum]|nr:SRPBCC family protein [Noviherbaspirillum autotrophicum]